MSLRGADIIVATPDQLKEPKIIEALKGAKVLISDEASRMLEPEIHAILQAYRAAIAKIMVGDFLQLNTIFSTSAKSGNYFAPQLNVSLMARLVRAGFPMTSLDTQYRMIPAIAAAAHAIIYRDRLQNDTSVELKNRPMAMAFRKFTKATFDQHLSIAYLNIADTETKLTEVQSRYNDKFVMNGILLAKGLINSIPDCTVAYLPFYSAHHRAIKLAKEAMVKALKENRKYSEIFVDTVDACQGLQFDFGIVDILVHGNSAGFMTKANRLNVATTRWRNGLIIQSNKSSVDSCEKRQAHYLQSYRSHFLSGHVKVPKILDCPYYAVGKLDA